MRRRRFLHLGVRTLAAGAVLPAADGLMSISSALDPLLEQDPTSPAPPLLAVARGESSDAVTRAAVGALGGMERFVSRGDRVVLKPNISWDRTPEQAATTNPGVVASVVRMCIEAGARSVLVMDNTCVDARRCYRNSGIEEAAKNAGATVDFFEEERTRMMKIGGVRLTEWRVHPAFVENDVLINIPIAKHHALTRLTLGMKNWLGALGGSRGRLHQDLEGIIVDLAAFFRPQLTVIDCMRILTGGGPQGGSLDHVKRMDTVIASADPVAADVRAVRVFDQDPADYAYLEMAGERGLGRLAWEPAEEALLEI